MRITSIEGRNLIAAFFNIDGYILDGVLTEEQQERFCRDPIHYFLRCEAEQRQAIWEAVWDRHTGRGGARK
jgi:hypothetical protein